MSNPSGPATSTAGAGSFVAGVYVFTAVMIGTTLPTPIYPSYQQEFDFGGSTTTQLFAVYAVGVVLALVLAGRASDIVGRKPVVLAGIVFSLLSAVLFIIGDPLGLLFVGRVLSGFSAGLLTSTGTVMVAESAPRGRERAAGAAATAANIGGLGLGMLISGVVAELTGAPTRAPFVVDAVLLVLAGLAWTRITETVTRTPGARLRVQRPRVPVEIRSLFVVASIGGVAGFAVCGLFSSVAPNFVSQVIGVHDAAVVGLVTSLLFLSSAAAQIALSGLAVVPGVRLGCVALVVGMAVLVTALLLGSLPLLIASSVIAGAGQGLLFNKGLKALTGAVDPDQRAETTTSYFVVAYLAISIPTVLVGLAVKRWGFTPAGSVYAGLVAALSVVGLLAAGRLRERPR